jgi:hypothetical protein
MDSDCLESIMNHSGIDLSPLFADDADLGAVRFAELKDLPYVVDLSKKESHCLGFIPKVAYEAAITGVKKGKRWSDVCNDRLFIIECNGDLVGFCLASFGRLNAKNRVGKVAQIVLQSDARKISRGRLLLDAVTKYALEMHGVNIFDCGCAEDLESNLFWQAMGWVRIGERKGISHTNTWKQTSDRTVNLYRYDPLDLLNTYNNLTRFFK